MHPCRIASTLLFCSSLALAQSTFTSADNQPGGAPVETIRHRMFVEIYDADIDNPSNATTITTLYGRLP